MVTTPAALQANPSSLPGNWFLAVTKHDTNLLTGSPRSLYIGGAGDVTVQPVGGTTGDEVTFTAVPAGMILPIRVQRVMSTGTTATAIVALY